MADPRIASLRYSAIQVSRVFHLKRHHWPQDMRQADWPFRVGIFGYEANSLQSELDGYRNGSLSVAAHLQVLLQADGCEVHMTTRPGRSRALCRRLLPALAALICGCPEPHKLLSILGGCAKPLY